MLRFVSESTRTRSFISGANLTYLRARDGRALARERKKYRDLPFGLRNRITVPIATYDRIEILRARTLPSILNQSHSNLEVIVVGDGTDPDLFALLEEIDDPRLHCFRLHKRTRYPADPLEKWMVAGWKPRNFGADAASGGWLYWMSDDDVLERQAFETLLRFSENNPELEVISGAYIIETRRPQLVTSLAGENGLPAPFSGMPAVLAKSYTRAFRWNRLSHLKTHNRPSDYDLFGRMWDTGLRFGSTNAVVARVVPLNGTDLTGSRAFAVEDLRRPQ